MRLLHRYVTGELLRVFFLTLTALTLLLVVVGVAGEASKSGLGPAQVLQILPYIIPSLLPYTLPATVLFAVSLVYGRMSGDNEITALKSAGVSVLHVLWPSFVLGLVLSAATFVLTDRFIPWARAGIRETVAGALEEILYDVLRSRRELSDDRAGFSITVRDVAGRELIMPTFTYRRPGSETILVAQAQTATLEIDAETQTALIHMEEANVNTGLDSTAYVQSYTHPFALPEEIGESDLRARDLPIRDVTRRMRELEAQMTELDERRAVETAMNLTRGRFAELFTPQQAGQDYVRSSYLGDWRKLNAEIYTRFSLSFGCLFFVLVGGPFALWQARRDFLTNFMTCFFPILLVYYPLFLLTLNLSKNGRVDPAWAMWSGNLLTAVFAVFVLRKVLRH